MRRIGAMITGRESELREIAPRVERVALLFNPAQAPTAEYRRCSPGVSHEMIYSRERRLSSWSGRVAALGTMSFSSISFCIT